MPTFFRKAEKVISQRVRIKPPQGFVARSAFWLGSFFSVLLLLRLAHIWDNDGSGASLILTGIPLSIFAFILLWRWVFRRLLWRVRNRLIVTYLLMGLAPVTLFVTLAGIAAYVFSGQFATFAANSELNAKQSRLTAENRGLATHLSMVYAANPGMHPIELPEFREAASEELDPASLDVGGEIDGKPIVLTSAGRQLLSNVAPPTWTTQDVHGLMIDDGRIFFRAVDHRTVNAHVITAHTSLLLTSGMLQQMASGLGRLSVAQVFGFKDDQDEPEAAKNHVSQPGKQGKTRIESVAGGLLPGAAHFYDRTVYFTAPLTVTEWHSGDTVDGMLLDVQSRPALLYQRLFGSSVQVAAFVRTALITIAIFFGLLELFAFVMAIGLSRTITQSISDLYSATRAIDAGQLEHRIQVTRRDQLAALSTSFNTMAQSLAHLLEQQREKERLQTELAIALEVQNSLLPQGQIRLPMLEVHGVSKPARSVSGDYYDFLLTGRLQLFLALGDISGKGISAALLMASLHSAVRAYRFGESGPGPFVMDGQTNFLASPALMLEKLNRHLFTSTQPEKYATLFLAHYDGADSSLTYATGGQLPPLVLCANGDVKRLDCGGSVVGLLDGMVYEQATVKLGPGDIVIIYSDGVTEPENEFGDFGEDRLLDLVKRNRGQSLEVISGAVMQSLRTWIGEQEQPDDITLVLARQV